MSRDFFVSTVIFVRSAVYTITDELEEFVEALQAARRT